MKECYCFTMDINILQYDINIFNKLFKIPMKQLNKVLFTTFMATIIILLGVSKSISQVTDYDSNVYKTVTIGTQEWTAENLNVEHYRNGDLIPHVQDPEDWSRLTTGAWCYYNNDSENGKVYGKLYNWYAVTDTRGLSPKGWHIPDDGEWNILADLLGGEELAGGKLKATNLWSSPNFKATNESDFFALPGGIRTGNGSFSFLGMSCYLWTSTEIGKNKEWSWMRELLFDFSKIHRSNSGYKGCGMSVRCIKDY